MAWEHYHLVFRLESPLHIGWRKAGNLMQTRRYVPGKNLWAALTAALVRRAGHGHDPGAYQAVGAELQRHFRFGYLWPAHGTRQSDGLWAVPTAPHFPWEEPQGPEYWDYLYLNGTARTAQDVATRAASEGMLHQVEFIAPYTREEQPVYLVGDLWARRDAPSEIHHNAATIPLPWEQALQRLQIGGERGYGWGRIRLVACRANTPFTWPGWSWQGQEDAVVLSPPEQDGTRLPAHALAVDFTDTERAPHGLQGAVEPWLGWERTVTGGRLSQARIMYAPGTRLAAADASGLTLSAWGYLYAAA